MGRKRPSRTDHDCECGGECACREDDRTPIGLMRFGGDPDIGLSDSSPPPERRRSGGNILENNRSQSGGRKGRNSKVIKRRGRCRSGNFSAAR